MPDTGYGIKIPWREQDVLISTGGMRDKFKIDCRMKNSKSHDSLTKEINLSSGRATRSLKGVK